MVVRATAEMRVNGRMANLERRRGGIFVTVPPKIDKGEGQYAVYFRREVGTTKSLTMQSQTIPLRD